MYAIGLVEGDGSGGRCVRGIRGSGGGADPWEVHDVRADSIGKRADSQERRKNGTKFSFYLYS
jgi:hypothetical protein